MGDWAGGVDGGAGWGENNQNGNFEVCFSRENSPRNYLNYNILTLDVINQKIFAEVLLERVFFGNFCAIYF